MKLATIYIYQKKLFFYHMMLIFLNGKRSVARSTVARRRVARGHLLAGTFAR